MEQRSLNNRFQFSVFSFQFSVFRGCISFLLPDEEERRPRRVGAGTPLSLINGFATHTFSEMLKTEN
jgi:hypothetical protein